MGKYRKAKKLTLKNSINTSAAFIKECREISTDAEAISLLI